MGINGNPTYWHNADNNNSMIEQPKDTKLARYKNVKGYWMITTETARTSGSYDVSGNADQWQRKMALNF